MKKCTKLTAILLVICMVFSLTACGKKAEEKTMFQVLKEANTMEDFTMSMDMNMTEATIGDIVIHADGNFSIAKKAANLTMEMTMEGDTINIGDILLIEDTLYWDFTSLLGYMELTPDDISSLLAMFGSDTGNFESFTCVSIKLFDLFENRDKALELSNLFIDTYEKAVKKTDEKMISLADGVYSMKMDMEKSTAFVSNLAAAIEEDIEPLYDALAEYVATLDLSFVEELITPILEMTGETIDGFDFSELKTMTSALKENKEEYLPQVKELLTEAIAEMDTAMDDIAASDDASVEQTLQVSLSGKEGSRVFTTKTEMVESIPDLGDVSTTATNDYRNKRSCCCYRSSCKH